MAGSGPRAVAWAVALWALWTLATWWLEGRIGTLNRPEAVLDRLVYTIVANILVGLVGGALLLRTLIGGDVAGIRRAGFGPLRRTLVWIPAGLALGALLYVAQGAPSLDPVVLANLFCQVLVVSIAEVVVCWSLVGGTTALAIGGPSWMSVAVAILAASLLFGLYHVAHSPPFDTLRMVVLLSAVGVVTGVFFFVSGDVYATILFHNCFALFGVAQALAARGAIAGFESLQVPLVATAAAGLAVLVAVDTLFIRRGIG